MDSQTSRQRECSIYVSNRRVYVLSCIYSSHIPNMVIIHDARWPCSLLTLVPVTRYINIMLLIIGAHNVTLDLQSVLHNAQLMYTTYVQHAHNQHLFAHEEEPLAEASVMQLARGRLDWFPCFAAFASFFLRDSLNSHSCSMRPINSWLSIHFLGSWSGLSTYAGTY